MTLSRLDFRGQRPSGGGRPQFRPRHRGLVRRRPLALQLALRPLDQFVAVLCGAGLVERPGGVGVRRQRRRLDPRRQVGAEELLPQRGQQLAVDSSAILEAHFQFRRMNIDVDQIRGHLQTDKGDRRAAGQQQTAIGFAQRMLQRTVADVPAVQEQVLHAVVGPAVVRIRHVSGQADLAVVAGHRNQRLADLAAEERQDAFPPAVHRRQIVDRTLVVLQREMDLRMHQGDADKRFRDVPHFGLGGAEELAPHGRVEKQLPDFDDRTHGTSARHDRAGLAAAHLQLGSGLLGPRAAADQELADFGNRRQRLAAKPERPNVEQVVGAGNLAGRMAGHGQQQLVGLDPAAVVGHPHQFRAAFFDRHVDPAGSGVDRVLHQLLDDTGRTFNDLAGGDLVDHAG